MEESSPLSPERGEPEWVKASNELLGQAQFEVRFSVINWLMQDKEGLPIPLTGDFGEYEEANGTYLMKGIIWEFREVDMGSGLEPAMSLIRPKFAKDGQPVLDETADNLAAGDEELNTHQYLIVPYNWINFDKPVIYTPITKLDYK